MCIYNHLRKYVSVVFVLFLLLAAIGVGAQAAVADDPFVLEGNEAALVNNIVITIDDCSIEANVRWALEILKAHEVTATFFPLTKHIKAQDPQLWRDVVAAGNEIGYHTRLHIPGMKAEELAADFVHFSNEIREILGDPGYTIRFVRPPAGHWDKEWLRWGQDCGLITVKWNAVLPDISLAYFQGVVSNRQRGGSILLLHTDLEDLQWLQANLAEIKTFQDADRNTYRVVKLAEALAD